MGTNSSSSASSLSSKTAQQVAVAVPHNKSLDQRIADFLLFFSMSLFSYFTTTLALRLMQRARQASAAGGTRDRRGINPSINRWINAHLGQLNPDMRSRLRLAFMNRDFDGNDYEMLNQLDEQNVPRTAATEAEINRLPLHTITQSNIDSALHESNAHQPNTPSSSSPSSSSSLRFACSICLAPYEPGDVVRTVLCMHQFHRDCIDSWLRNKNECPVCKCPGTG
jgi:hypothetical protein